MSAEEEAKPRVKDCYVGAPAIFALELACQDLNRAFDGHCYLVGSTLTRTDWRDVDVRLIMDDAAFIALFPSAQSEGVPANWEFDQRWLWMTVSISERMSRLTGLPIDFQFQPRTHANAFHKGGGRNALGMSFAKGDPE